MKVLITGFEPFGEDALNPSKMLVDHLKPQYGEVHIVTAVLPVVFGKALKVLDDLMHTHRPDVVIALGQAAGRSYLTIERVGINIDDARIPDNEGQMPIDQPIVANGPDGYFSTLPIKAIVKALQDAKIPAGVSNTAGTYVCNHVLYGLCHMIQEHYPGTRGGFIHLPYIPEQVPLGQAPSMSLDLLIRGIELVIQVCATCDNDIKISGGMEC